ncbi:hypothetical protein DX904_03570 [Adlercreutzia equolifaciens subsp. celatus]|nr:hypothetical protein DX904_03570 [Adlercreutzia equolifaciens subsp. celatus]
MSQDSAHRFGASEAGVSRDEALKDLGDDRFAFQPTQIPRYNPCGCLAPAPFQSQATTACEILGYCGLMGEGNREIGEIIPYN